MKPASPFAWTPSSRNRDHASEHRCSARRSHLQSVLTVLATAFVVGLFAVTPALAQLPHARLSWVYPAGGKIGTEVEVTVGGTDLDEATSLLFSHPGITAKAKMNPPTLLIKEPQPVDNTFLVNIAADVPPGLYEVRTVGKYGASTPRAFAVGDLEEVTKVNGNLSLEKAQEITIGSTVNGRTVTDGKDYYKFKAEAGQRITISVWAYRIDSKVDGTVVLYDATGNELAASRDVKGFDPVIDYTAPAAGEYYISVYDFTYRSGPEYAYRVSLSAKPYLEYVFPPSGQAGTTSKFTLYGYNLPGGKTAADPLAAKQGLQQLEVDVALPAQPPVLHPAVSGSVAEPQDENFDGFVYRLSSSSGVSNPVFISYATAPLVLEVEPANNDSEKPQVLTLPAEVVGQFSPNRDADWFTFEAKKGDVYSVEVFSQRLGLPTDPQLVIQQRIETEKVEKPAEGETGEGKKYTEITYKDIVVGDDLDLKLANPGFDRASDDPIARFAAPADSTYRVLVKDLYSGTRATPRLVYRLAIRAESPDFRLLATCKNLTDVDKNKLLTYTPVLRKGGTQRIMVQLYPIDGFNEPVTLSVEGLPAGVTCPPVVATPADKQATLILQAAADAAEWSGPITIVGKAKVGDKEISHPARAAYVVWDKAAAADFTYAKIAQQLVLSVTAETDPGTVQTGIDSGVIETARGGSVEIPIKVARAEGFKGGLKLDPVGLPKEITIASLTLDEKTAEGKMTLKVTAAAKPGDYSLFISGQTKLAYKRNEEAVTKATEVKTAAEAALTALKESVTKANADKAAADKDAAAKTAAVTAATTALAAATKAVADTTAAAKAATDKAAQAKDAAGKATDDQALATAATAAEKAATDAAAAQKTAADALEVAKKTMADAVAAQKAATEAQAVAVKAAADAAENVKKATAEKTAIDKAVTDLTNAAKPKDIDVFLQTLPIALKVAEAPVSIKLAAPAVGTVKQGEKLEVPVTIERLYGFADVVNLVVVLPKGAAGVSGTLDLPANQTAGKLTLVTDKNAKVGDLKFDLAAKVKFNGQAVETSVPVELKVEAPPAPEKK